MGCDIHLHVEKRTPTGWHHVPGVDYDDRSYNTFAVLADVRNGLGFAGIKTGERLNPIAPPRGLPRDCSAFVRDDSKGWGVDGHSHSWFTLAELQAYDWNQASTHTGVVTPAEYIVFREKGKPNGWSGEVWGRDARHITHEDMDRYVAAGCPQDGLSRYTKVEWRESYADACGSFVEKFMPELAKLGAPEDMRIVFWFDN